MKRALLIGIATYRDRNIPALPVIERDLALLEDVLRAGAYDDVRVRGRDGSAGWITRNEIRREIRTLCNQAGEGDTLLVYLSGHGLHYDGRDYLVPWDAWWDDPRDFPETLVPLDFAADLDKSRAHTMVVFIDACREGIDMGVKSVTMSQWGQGQHARAKKRHLAMCFACEPGEYARFVAGVDGFSLLAKALATVLHPGHPARTLGDVCKAAQQALDDLTRHHEKPAQHIRTLFEMDMRGTSESSVLAREICAGEPDARDHGRHRAESVAAELASTDEHVRLVALSRIAIARHAEFLEPVSDLMLHDASAQVRQRAAWALDNLNDPKSAPALLQAIHDPSWDVRSAAGWALVHLGTCIRAKVEAIVEHSSHAEVREMARLILDRLDDSKHQLSGISNS